MGLRRTGSPLRGSPDHEQERGDIFRVGVFLDFVWPTTRTEGPHGGASYARGAKRTRIDPHRGWVVRLAARTWNCASLTTVGRLKVSAWISDQMDGFSSLYAPSKAHHTQGGELPRSCTRGAGGLRKPVSTTPAPRQHHASTTSAPRQRTRTRHLVVRLHSVWYLHARCERVAEARAGAVALEVAQLGRVVGPPAAPFAVPACQ